MTECCVCLRAACLPAASSLAASLPLLLLQTTNDGIIFAVVSASVVPTVAPDTIKQAAIHLHFAGPPELVLSQCCHQCKHDGWS